VTCQADLDLCAGTCTNLQTDNANCGACSQACPGGQVCDHGNCATTCRPDLTTCSQPLGDGGSAPACADITADRLNCGGCGVACAAGEICEDGACAVSCGNALSTCLGDVGDGGTFSYCANLAGDVNNCGACGTVCGQGTTCQDGHCATTCQPGETLCTGSDGGAYCANTASDSADCGACGTACSQGTVCSLGQCATTCQPGETLCTGSDGGAYCANTASDNANCGACGTACSQGTACSLGQCVTTCQPSETMCAGAGGGAYCANTASDNANCGTCGNTCAQGTACSLGQCAITCQPNQTRCLQGDGGATCSDLQSDSANCGACGNACGTNTTCVSGGCATYNPTHFTVLASNQVTYQGYNYVAVKVALSSLDSAGETWCDDYEQLCKVVFGGVPVGCGPPYNPGNAGYETCGTLYDSNGVNGTLSCNPSYGVAAAATSAGFSAATSMNSFGFHYCGTNHEYCTKTWCSGEYCSTSLSYMDSSEPSGYTLCLVP